MVTYEEYLKAKAIVEVWEQQGCDHEDNWERQGYDHWDGGTWLEDEKEREEELAEMAARSTKTQNPGTPISP